MPRMWRPAATNCCKVESGAVIGSLSRCRPTRTEFSKKVAGMSSFRRFSMYPDVMSTSSSARFAGDYGFAPGLVAFRVSELKAATHNFSGDYLLGEGGFGTVHKGYIDDKMRLGLKAQPVAVKLLDVEGLQGHREWLAEVIFLGELRHPHLVKLIGYCCEAEERLLVYEFMPRGSLENHLFRRISIGLPWGTRLKIAIGAAKGLAFLHGAQNPVIYRDFKASNILLDADYTAKLSDFGLAKMGPEGEATHVTTRVMGTHGYAAPEYIMTGHLTTKSDVYSYGVVLLELLTGRRSVDKTKPKSEEKLVDWVGPYLSNGRKLRYVMDPKLGGQYSVKAAKEVAAVALQCISPRPKDRPRMSTTVEILQGVQNLKDMAGSTHPLLRPRPRPGPAVSSKARLSSFSAKLK